MTKEQRDRLPDDHPLKHENFFSFGGIDFRPSSDSEVEKFEVEQKALQEKKRKDKLEEQYRKASGVPERYWNESLDTYVPHSKETAYALEVARKFVNSKRRGRILILCGKPGTGKTHLACGILRELGGKYTTLQKILYRIDSAMSFKASETKMDILNEVTASTGVVFDEVGRGGRTESAMELAGYFINELYSALRWIVIVSNLSKKDLVGALGLAVKDRLNELAFAIEFSGPSYREKKRKDECTWMEDE